MDVCYLDIKGEVNLHSDVNMLSLHPNPDIFLPTHSYPFPLAGEGPFLCTQSYPLIFYFLFLFIINYTLLFHFVIYLFLTNL